MSDDDTFRVPVFTDPPRDPYQYERVLFLWLVIAYACAGGILSFACFQMAAAADQITNAPLCRRL